MSGIESMPVEIEYGGLQGSWKRKTKDRPCSGEGREASKGNVSRSVDQVATEGKLCGQVAAVT